MKLTKLREIKYKIVLQLIETKYEEKVLTIHFLPHIVDLYSGNKSWNLVLMSKGLILKNLKSYLVPNISRQQVKMISSKIVMQVKTQTPMLLNL